MASITVIDDVAVNRELLVALLKPFGHRVTEAADGASALELVRAERPALIICDILMPGMDGYEFVRCLRADPLVATTPVIFCSAHFMALEAQQLAAVCGVSKVLSKPIDPQELLDSVRTILDQGSPAGAPPGLPVNEFDRQHLQLVSAKLSEKVAELEATNAKLAALIELNLRLGSERDKERLLAHVCQGARTLLGAEVGSVAVRTTDGAALAHVSHCGLAAAALEGMGPVRLDAGELGRVYRDSVVVHRVLAADAAIDSGLPAAYPPLKEMLAAPVRSLSASYGWICLGNKRNGEGFSADDAEVLRILAAQAGRVYENGSLYVKLQNYAHELEAGIDERERTRRHLEAQFSVARILNEAASVDAASGKFLEAICTELGFAAATIWRADEAEQRLRCVDVWCHLPVPCAGFVEHTRALALAPDSGLPGAAWASGETVWWPDLQHSANLVRHQAARELGLNSGGATPIMTGGRITGVLDVFRREPGEMDARLAGTLATLGNQIGQFFERIAQQQRALRLTRVYAVLSGINAAIVRIHDRIQLFREGCRVAVEEGGFGIAWIGMIDPVRDEVVPMAWAGVEDAIAADRLSLRHDIAAGKGAVAQAMHSGTTCVVNDLARLDPVGKRREEAQRRGYRSLIALPLIVDARVVGTMVLYAAEADFFTAEEQTLLNELANDLSFALEYIAKQDMLAYLAYHDVLTGLPNRAHLLDRLGLGLQAARDHPRDRVAVVVWDVNRFRNINDSLGRKVGDQVLRELAQRFRAVWPGHGAVARISVDQFAGVLCGEYELTDIAHLIEQAALGGLGQPVVVGEHELRLAVSAGIAVSTGPDDDADTLIRNAEAALRKAKESGVGYLFYGPEMNALIADTLLRENRLRQALERDEFVLHYQPKICGASGRVVGVEALLRWNDPATGLVQPGSFIPILEETGMIIPVGLWAIRQALADAQRWREAGLEPLRVAVNVSALQLQQPGFVDALAGVVAEFGDNARWLDLEITESMIMADLDATVARLTQIRRMGIEIAIDDFGTGYSSLGYLAKLPVNALKIDRSFVATMGDSSESMTIVSTIISLAHSLDLKVVAEGVEEEDQSRFLRLFKCNELQGYLISRPLPAERIADFVCGRSDRRLRPRVA